MSAQKSVHIDCAIRIPATGNTSSAGGTESYDVGTDSGRNTSDYGGAGDITDLVVGGVGYESVSNEGVLVASGFSQSSAEELAGGWFSIHPGDSFGPFTYANVARGVTIATAANELRMTAPLKRTALTRQQGSAVYGVSGGANAYFSTTTNLASSTETVYIAASGAPLPVSLSARASNGTVTTCDYSRWGEPLHLTAPAHSVPISSVL
jgi:hypothetical protein